MKVIILKCVLGLNWWMNWIKKVFIWMKFCIWMFLDVLMIRYMFSFFFLYGDGIDKKIYSIFYEI